MKITDVQACVIGRPEPHSGGCVWTFVRIYTDEGIVGTGECNSASAYTGFGLKQTILQMKGLLIGQNPFDIGPLYETLRRRGRYAGTGNAPIIFAITGIENALYDIVGKALNTPIYNLLGGKYRDNIRLYADCHAGETNEPAAYAEKALEVIAEGYSAVKFDVDGASAGKLDAYNWTVGAKEMTDVISLISATREAIGYEIDLAIDCHGQFDFALSHYLGQGGGGFAADVVRRAFAGGKRRCPGPGAGFDQHGDLHRRKPVQPASSLSSFCKRRPSM